VSAPRIGQGVDFHRLVAGRPLWLGGVEVPFDRGLEGHSDGDALLHAVADALLGALGEGDIGAHFPSSDESLRGIASSQLLTRVVAIMRGAGYRVGNVDATILAQAPRLAPHQEAMRSRLAALLGVEEASVNLKVTSTDGMGAIGREEGIAAQAVALLVAEGSPGADRPNAGEGAS
jgi:2-C-methyl-D-erythritol 2,4-cyclodiphosphate synthase